jgi:hypothetical protein
MLMKNNGNVMARWRGLPSMMALAAFWAFLMLSPNAAFSATVVIDDLAVSQGSQFPPILVLTAAGISAVASTSQAAPPPIHIAGSTRKLQLVLDSADNCNLQTYVDGSLILADKRWSVSNTPGCTGRGRMVWNDGAAGIEDFSTNPIVDLSNLQSIYFPVFYADHATTFTFALWSDNSHCSRLQYTCTDETGANPCKPEKSVTFTSLTTCPATPGNPATLSQIRRMELTFTSAADLDVKVGPITALTESPSDMSCDHKWWTTSNTYADLSPALNLASSPPTLYTEVSVINGLNVASDRVMVVDHLPAGMAYAAGSTVTPSPSPPSPAGFTFAEPDLTDPHNPVWTSSAGSILAAGQTATLRYAVTLTTPLTPDVLVQNDAQAKGFTEASYVGTCSATVILTNRKVPAMSEWSAILAMVILAGAGIYLVRRKSLS